jgi:hypothetical protein
VGTPLKKLTCLTLALLLAGCIPIGLKTQSLPLTSTPTTSPTA